MSEVDDKVTISRDALYRVLRACFRHAWRRTARDVEALTAKMPEEREADRAR